MPTLYNSSKEIRNVAKLFSSNTFYNENATKNNFINQIKNHNIIHIASHANASDSIMPWVAFNDSKVYIEDIYNTTNSAELVVLSACNTSLGEIYEGEGVMSLSRGFFNTGANSVISTLWSVNDKSTAEIINEFFTNLKEGSSKSNALHKAKLNYIKNHSLSESSPYYWSSLILIGDAGKIPIESENYTFTIISFITLFILLILIYKIK